MMRTSVTNSNLETSPRKMAEIQNRYYIDKVHDIRNNLQSQNNKNPLDLLQQKLGGNQASFSTKPVTPEEVMKIISQLRNSKASGLDNLDTYILKLTKQNIVPAVCHILNLSPQQQLPCYRCTRLGWRPLRKVIWQVYV